MTRTGEYDSSSDSTESSGERQDTGTAVENIVHLRYGSAGVGITTGPRMAGPAFELNLGVAEADGIALSREAAAYFEAGLGQGGLAADFTEGNVEGHGGYAPELIGGMHYRFSDFPFLESCTGLLGGAMSFRTGFERETDANEVSVGVSGGAVCQDSDLLLMLNLIAGTSVNLRDGPYGGSAATARRDHVPEGAVMAGARATLGTSSGMLLSVGGQLSVQLDGNTIASAEAELAYPVFRFNRDHAVFAGAYGRLMERTDLEGDTVGGVAGGLTVGVGALMGVSE
jgi:hypothetical protein